MKLGSLAVVVGSAAVAAVTTILITGMGSTTAANALQDKGPVFAQLSSTVTQKPKGTPLIVQMESEDAIGGLGHSKDKPSEVVVKAPGMYFIMAAAQVGKETGEGDEFVDLWIKQNGKDVDNSNTRQALKDAKFTSVLVCQGIAECKAGDVITVAVSASSADKGAGIVAIKPKSEPVIPSIIFSMFKIN